MSEVAPEDVPAAVPVVWVGGDELPVIAVNQFLVQVDQGEIYLMAGTLTPPVILGDNPEDIRRQVEAIGFVPVRTAARFALTPRRLKELIRLLERSVEMYDRQAEARRNDNDNGV